jgi:predicted ester cyclase
MNKVRSIIIIAVALAITACSSNNYSDQSNKSVMDSTQQKIEANKQLVRLWIEDGWNNNRNAEVVDQVFAQNWEDGNPTFPDQPQGIAGAMYFVEQYRKALPDIQFTITHLVAEQDIVTFRFEAKATHKGTLMGIAPTNKKVSITGIVIHKVVNGRFAKSWNEVDLLGLKAQLEAP